MGCSSPGMEIGPRKDPFSVLLVSITGKESAFSIYPK
jgi:hypothetical protein